MRLLTRNTPARPPYRVRAAAAGDAELLVPLCAAHAAYEQLPYSPAGHADRLRAALASGQLHAWLLLDDDDGSVVGYACATVDFATLSARRFAHLDCLYLAPMARGKGGGQRLVHAVQAFARAHACSTLQWQTPEWNVGAMRFYARLGATPLPKQRYTLALDDRVPNQPLAPVQSA